MPGRRGCMDAHRTHIAENQQPAHVGLSACVRRCVWSLWMISFISSPTDSNCTYFKFFTSGENAVIFKKTTNKSETVVHFTSSYIQMHTETHWDLIKMFTGLFRGPCSSFCQHTVRVPTRHEVCVCSRVGSSLSASYGYTARTHYVILLQHDIKLCHSLNIW